MKAFAHRLSKLGIVVFLGLCCSCAHTTRGTSLSGERIAFIQDGNTTRSEIIESLGQPLYDFKSERTVGYLWETVSPDVAANFAANYFDDNHETIYRDPELWIFFVSFDQNNRVSRHGRAHMPNGESSQEVLLKWLKIK